MKMPNDSKIIKTQRTASEQSFRNTKPTLGKYLTFKSNSKVEYSPFFKPVFDIHNSEITINERYEWEGKTAGRVKSSDSQLIPTPRTPKNPQEDLRRSLLKLKSIYGNEAVLALRDIIQISRFHPYVLEKSMPTIYKGIIAMLTSLRTSVARTACRAANELFMNIPFDHKQGFNDLIHALLKKTIDPNKALRDDALEALDSMVIHVPPAQSIKALLHRRIAAYDLNIRITASKLLTCALGDNDAHSPAVINENIKTKLVFAAIKFLQDPNCDIKFHGMRLITMLMEQKEFQNIFQTKITEDLLQNLLNIVETTKTRIRYADM